MNAIARIGVFDSGVGGLTVLAACMKKLAGCSFYYFGDNAHAPYGNRSEAEITEFVFRGLRRFRRIGVDAAVLACNTATAVCAERARNAFAFPVVGMEPAVRPAAASCRRVLVLATPLTAASRRLERLTASFPDTSFTICGLSGFAGAIERALTCGEPLTISDHLPQGRYDGVVLGCTHYVFFRDEIARFYGCKVFDGGEGTANRLQSLLIQKHKYSLFGTDDHFDPSQNPNICFTKKYKEMRKFRVFFLGNSAKTNKSVFLTNICFKKI